MQIVLASVPLHGQHPVGKYPIGGSIPQPRNRQQTLPSPYLPFSEITLRLQ